MPIDPADAATNAYGIWPFGVHGAGHSFDGHPGWDVEFRPGAMLRAPADGRVLTVVPDPSSAQLFTIQIEHGSSRYRTDYTNLASLAPGIAVGATVQAGQPIATPATITAFVGSRQITYAMTHFQTDDMEHNHGQSNPFAVNPETFLGASGRAVFDALWRTAAYEGELVEPFSGNERDVAFPITRTWTRESGSLAARIELTRHSGEGSDYTYAMSGGDGTTIERGTATVDPRARPSTIDLQPAGGALRRGVWNVVSGEMQIHYGAPGAARPASLADASIYRTNP